ncbi:hypothetical protein PVAND_015744 [Polypedilum vanderplanki]|uniref:Chitin-binding type-2 domain-containing protein n=1 Tax=Polypedilum vanderplanki TaxID=319348 RepID=A0A9J6BE12_POLVA|nr:hypothetical protein PVAND_015744 [Polypedilum vanderplanki]
MKKFSFLIFTLTICAINGFNWNFLNVFHSEIEKTVPEIDCTQFVDGQRFPDAKECSIFYRCINGRGIEFRCPPERPNFNTCNLECVTEEEFHVCGEPCSYASPAPANIPTAGTKTTSYTPPTAPTQPIKV